MSPEEMNVKSNQCGSPVDKLAKNPQMPAPQGIGEVKELTVEEIIDFKIRELTRQIIELERLKAESNYQLLNLPFSTIRRLNYIPVS